MCAGPKRATGSVAHTRVERHADDSDVRASDFVETWQPGEGRRTGEARYDGRVDRTTWPAGHASIHARNLAPQPSRSH